jgi:2-oxoisovalerate dehydrogenase E1 component alpha subunit
VSNPSGPAPDLTASGALPDLYAGGAAPEVGLVQLLTPEGERITHDAYAFSGDDETIRGYYRDMVLTRRVDTEATALQRQGELGIWASCLGQEAAQIGSGRALRSQDYVFPTYREHGVAWCCDVDPLKLLSLFRGVDMGSWDSAKTRFHLYTIVIGVQALHATGYAMGLERDGVVGTGDPQRDPIERQSRIPLYQRAAGFGFPGIRVDGNDVLAVQAVTTEALERARSGNGPTLIEAFTYRMGAHTTSDDPTKYRLADELEHWRLKDPIARVKAYLTRSGGADESFFSDVDAEATQLASTLRAQCLALPEPRMVDAFDWVYAEQTPYLAEQQARYAEYVESFADSGVGQS